MRGDETEQGPMFSYVSPAQRVPSDHPLRRIREMSDVALKSLSREFDRLYSKVGRPSIAPERLLRALLLQYFYGIRSERLLMEQLDYNLLFRWFVGLSMDDPVWDASTFSKNRERLLAGDIAQRFLEAVLAQAKAGDLTSDEHFSIDGTLIEAWASQKSFKPKDGSGRDGPQGRNPHVDFKGKPRKNDTHQSTTDPDARLYRKGDGQESKLSYLGHVVMENRREAHAKPGGHSTRGAEHVSSQQCDRQSHDAPSWLLSQPDSSQGRGASVWLAQSHSRHVAGQGPRQAAGAMDLHLRYGGLQPDPHAETASGAGLMGKTMSDPRGRGRKTSSSIATSAVASAFTRMPIHRHSSAAC